MSEPKVYVGSGKVVGKFGHVKISINVNKLPKPNDKGYINLIVAEKKEPGKFGETKMVYVDDWKPDPSKRSTGTTAQPVAANVAEIDLPF